MPRGKVLIAIRCEFVINAQERGRECQKLSNRKANVRRDVVVFAQDYGGERESDSDSERNACDCFFQYSLHVSEEENERKALTLRKDFND